MTPLQYDRDRVAQAQYLRQRWYNGETVERAPFVFSVTPETPVPPVNYRKMLSDPAAAVETLLHAMQYQFDAFPDCDYLPSMNLHYFGEGILASLYGAEQYIVDDNPPFTKGRVFKDIYDAQRITNDFTVEDTEWGRRLREHVLRFVDATGGEIPVEVADYQSPYGTATKLIPNEELMLAMYDAPDLVHIFLSAVTDGIEKLIRAMERWVGADLLALNRKCPIPGKAGIIVWEDYVSVLNPALHTEFCAPYINRLFSVYGKGHLHTCGPYFPSYIDACLACQPRSIDVSTFMRGQTKTRDDLLAFLDITKRERLKLFGLLRVSDQPVFDGGSAFADDDLLSRFVLGGWMPSHGGRFEEGMAFKKKIEEIGRIAV